MRKRERERHRADLCNLWRDHYLRQLPRIPRTSRLIRTESKNRVVRPQGMLAVLPLVRCVRINFFAGSSDERRGNPPRDPLFASPFHPLPRAFFSLPSTMMRDLNCYSNSTGTQSRGISYGAVSLDRLDACMHADVMPDPRENTSYIGIDILNLSRRYEIYI